MDLPGSGQAHHRQLADRIGLADLSARQACRRVSAAPRSHGFDARIERPRARISVPTRRAWSPSCRRARCPRSGATTSASSRPISRPSPAARPIRPSTGGWWTRTATGSSWAAPTTSSTWPAIAWARARSRNLSTATRPSPSAVVGVADALGQVAMAFAVLKNPAGAEAHAQQNKWAVTIAVSDDGGLLGMLRLDGGADLLAHRAGQGQDRRAGPPRVARVRRDHQQRPLFLPVGAAARRHAGRRRAGRGRWPCGRRRGVSGVKSSEDAQIAQAGIAALGL